MEMEGKILLSSSELRALASDTRASIIKMLRERNYTLSEMSKKLSLAAPTVKQHLGILKEAEMIQELDEGRKWKYYCLTRKGKSIFSSEAPVNVLIVLAVTVFALGGIMYSFLQTLGHRSSLGIASRIAAPAYVGVQKELVGAPEAAADNVIAAEPVAFTFTSFDPQMFGLLLTIVALSLIAGFLIARAVKRYY